jgi:hypothetical protein
VRRETVEHPFGSIKHWIGLLIGSREFVAAIAARYPETIAAAFGPLLVRG